MMGESAEVDSLSTKIQIKKLVLFFKSRFICREIKILFREKFFSLLYALICWRIVSQAEAFVGLCQEDLAEREGNRGCDHLNAGLDADAKAFGKSRGKIGLYDFSLGLGNVVLETIEFDFF